MAPPRKPTPTTPAQEIEKTPAGISPLARLIQGRTRPHVIVPLPGELGIGENGQPVNVALIALRDYEAEEVQLAAQRYLMETKKLPDYMLATDQGQRMMDVEAQIHALHEAMRDPDNLARKFTSSPMDVRMHLEPDERMALFQELLTFQALRSPLRRIETDEELKELALAVGKDEFPHAALSHYDSASLRSIIISLGALLVRQTRQRSSATGSPSDSTAETASSYSSTSDAPGEGADPDAPRGDEYTRE
jgi:hypothetical protein